MKEMKVRCTIREHADRVIEVAKRLGYSVVNDYMRGPDWKTLMLHKKGSGGFWRDTKYDYPEYALYGDHLLPVAEGWIENRGNCRVPYGTKIDVLYRDGAIVRSVGAGDRSYSKVEGAPGERRTAVWWGISSGPFDIIAYRLAESAADAPVEWDGTGKPPVGARVLLPQYVPYREGPLSGVIVLPPDSEGDYVIKDDDGVYWWASADDLRPVQSERDKAVEEPIKVIGAPAMTIKEAAEAVYDAGYRKTETNDG